MSFPKPCCQYTYQSAELLSCSDHSMFSQEVSMKTLSVAVMNLVWAAKTTSDTSSVASSCLAVSSLSSCIALLVYLLSSGTSGAGIPVEVKVLGVLY